MRAGTAQGFTLIELMIVLAIIAGLVAMALPSYESAVARGQLAEGLSLATQAKAAMVEFHAEHGRWPASNAEAGLPDTIRGQYVSAVELVAAPAGAIRISFGGAKAHAALQQQAMLLQASADQGAILWTCKPAGPGFKSEFLPSSCR